jgi:hypothetical protein
MNAAVTPTLDPTSTAESTPEVTPAAAYQADWEQVEVNGVRLRIEIPRGWVVQKTDEGLLIAERFGRMETVSTMPGMQIHLFVHSLDGFDLPDADDANVAWAVLEQVIQKPSYIGDAKVSKPKGFDWGGQDAAYYLLNDGDGSLSILVAVVIASPKRLIVCNFSSPIRQADEIRTMLPEVLSKLTINGVALDMAALDNLPDPLPFPEAEATPSR